MEVVSSRLDGMLVRSDKVAVGGLVALVGPGLLVAIEIDVRLLGVEFVGGGCDCHVVVLVLLLFDE